MIYEELYRLNTYVIVDYLSGGNILGAAARLDFSAAVEDEKHNGTTSMTDNKRG